MDGMSSVPPQWLVSPVTQPDEAAPFSPAQPRSFPALHLQLSLLNLRRSLSSPVSRMRRHKTRKIIVAAALGLLILHLYKYYSDDKIAHLDVENRNHIRQFTKENPFVYLWSNCQQNNTAANITGFESLPQNIKDFLYFQHCRHFPMLLDLPGKCGGAKKSEEVFLLLVVKSSPTNYDRREVLRKTWAEERTSNGRWIRRIFISGTTGTGFKKERLNKLLQVEQQEYSDILQWDFHDTFYNLTLKQVLFLEWMERNCPNARFLFNGDDDVFAHTDNIVVFLQSLQTNNGSQHLFTGHLIQNVGPIRSVESKYYIPEQVHKSESYPPYCGGGGFLLSGYTGKVIHQMSKSIPFLPIDDVYMGMCLAKAGLRPVSHMGVKTAGLHIPSDKFDPYNPCFYKEILLVHRFLPAQMYLMWNRIKDSNLSCDLT